MVIFIAYTFQNCRSLSYGARPEHTMPTLRGRNHKAGRSSYGLPVVQESFMGQGWLWPTTQMQTGWQPPSGSPGSRKAVASGMLSQETRLVFYWPAGCGNRSTRYLPASLPEAHTSVLITTDGRHTAYWGLFTVVPKSRWGIVI